MSLDPDERLSALRREVDSEQRASTPAEPPSDARPSAPSVAPPPATAPPATAPPATAAPVSTTVARTSPSSAPVAPPDGPAEPATTDGWDLRELLADTSLATWLGLGLFAVGGYLVLSWFLPNLDLVGSIIILGAGIVLLAQHFTRGAGAWTLYAGAVLAGIGAARVIGDILPGSPRGLTAMGVGVAFLAISYLRHTQAGGYGWQGALGIGLLGLGLVQFVLGLLPGAPGVIDLILPALLLIGGGFLLVRSRGQAEPPDGGAT